MLFLSINNNTPNAPKSSKLPVPANAPKNFTVLKGSDAPNARAASKTSDLPNARAASDESNAPELHTHAAGDTTKHAGHENARSCAQRPRAHYDKDSMFMRAFHSHPLGAGLRCVQLYFVCMLLAVLTAGAVSAPENFDYDLSLVCMLFISGGCALSVWIIQVRSARARAVSIACLIIGNALMFIDLHLGTFNKVSAYISVFLMIPERASAFAVNVFFLVEVVASVGVLIYLGTSQTVKDTLIYVYGYDDVLTGQTWDTPLLKRLKSWNFWRDIAIYFIVFSFLGHWAEIAFCQLIRAGIVMGDYDPSNDMLWNQWLYPFSAEGIAVALIVLLLHPISRLLLNKMGGRHLPAVVVSFFVNMIVCASIDFTLGITSNADYHLWDYRNMPFNFMGQVCLQNTLVYTTAATLIVWIIYPAMDRLLRRMPQLLLDGIFWFLAGVYGFCALLHFMYLSPWGFVFG